MTIAYKNDISIFSSLFKWKGSIWKAIYVDLILFMAFYYIINLSLRFALNDAQKETFCYVREYFEAEISNYNLIFILGFFLSHILHRLWQQYQLLMSQPFRVVTLIDTEIRADGNISEKEANLRRRCLVRWIYCMAILSYKRLNIRTRKRFPTTAHMVEAGLLTIEEQELIDECKAQAPFGNWWQPSVWVMNLLKKCKTEGVLDPVTYAHITDAFMQYRSDLGQLMSYHWVQIPLPYTQMVSVATFMYFAVEVLTHQMLPECGTDTYVPFFFIVKFILFVGILRVGEDLLDPFGEDDNDFEMTWIMDWSLNTSFLQIGYLHDQLPELELDPYLGCYVINLPHNKASTAVEQNPYVSRVEKIKLKEEDLAYVIGAKPMPTQFLDKKVKEAFMRRPSVFPDEQKLHTTNEDL